MGRVLGPQIGEFDLRRKYWEHGTGYVALGRTQTAASTGAFVDDASSLVRARNGAQARVPVMAAVCHPELLAR